jgi:hypothetical protein
MLHWTGHVGKISLAGIMEETRQLYTLRIASGLCLHGTVNAVLTHRIEASEVTIARQSILRAWAISKISISSDSGFKGSNITPV